MRATPAITAGLPWRCASSMKKAMPAPVHQRQAVFPARAKGDEPSRDPEQAEHRDQDRLEKEQPGEPALLNRCWFGGKRLSEVARPHPRESRPPRRITGRA